MKEMIEKFKRFIREVKAEMQKVTWPTWPELKGSTMLVIVLSVFFAVYIGLVDMLLSLVRRLWL
jgi:preprotein translocase subunit SecE